MSPLSGIRVLELSSVISGPFAAMMLADLGAEVIKVEPPKGDISRFFGPFFRDVSAYFHNVNRGKRSVVADLKTQEGLDLVLALVAQSDVLIENWRPGVAARLGIDAERLRTEVPSLITVAMRGFGETGPYSEDRVYDPVIQAVSSMASTQGRDGRPEMVRQILNDKLAALAAVQGVLAALVERGRTGAGTHVEVSMLDTSIAFQWPDMMLRETFTEKPRAKGEDRGVGAGGRRPSALLQCGDGRWFAYTAGTNRQWADLCELIERPEWIERYATRGDRAEFADSEINPELQKIFSMRSRDDVIADFRKADIACGPVNSMEDLFDDPQVRASGSVIEVDRPVVGRVREPGPFVKIGSEPWCVPSAPPALGEHTSEVLAELGMSLPADSTSAAN